MLLVYGLVVALLALMMAWWAVFFVRQGALLVARANEAGAALTPAQAEAVRQGADQSLRMFLFEGAFLLLALAAGVVLVVRATRREVVLARAQREFLSAVTHELRTPLASARLAIQSLALGRVPPEKTARYLASAETDLARLTELVERVLETARLGTARPRLRLERLDLAEFARQRGPELAAAHGLTLELALPEAVPVEADGAALETILRNLVANAAKYATGSTRLALAVARSGSEARLALRDFGPGVEGDPARLFEPFERGSGPLVASRPGVGLGLYLVAELVRALRGRIRARNAEPGPGFEVELHLPLAAEART